MTPNVDEKLCNERTKHLADAVHDLNCTCEKINRHLERLSEHEIKIMYLEKVVYGTLGTAVLALITSFVRMI